MKTDSDSPLRGNFGPTSARVSASPSLSSTHYGREYLCGAEGKKAVSSIGECSESRHRFSFNRAKRVIDGLMFGVPLELAEAE